MKKSEFITKTEAQFKELYPDQKVVVQRIQTSHGPYWGLTVTNPKAKTQTSPVVDLDRFYKDLKEHNFDFVFDEMTKIVEMDPPDVDILEIITNYDLAKEHLVVDPVEYRLPDIVGFGPDEFFLAVKLVIDLDGACGTVSVTQKLLDMWQKEKDDVIAKAIMNTLK